MAFIGTTIRLSPARQLLFFGSPDELPPLDPRELLNTVDRICERFTAGLAGLHEIASHILSTSLVPEVFSICEQLCDYEISVRSATAWKWKIEQKKLRYRLQHMRNVRSILRSLTVISFCYVVVAGTFICLIAVDDEVPGSELGQQTV